MALSLDKHLVKAFSLTLWSRLSACIPIANTVTLHPTQRLLMLYSQGYREAKYRRERCKSESVERSWENRKEWKMMRNREMPEIQKVMFLIYLLTSRIFECLEATYSET